MDCWFVLRVIVGHEGAVVQKLRQWDGFEAFCPLVVEFQLRHRKMTEIRRPLWPSYVFVSWPRANSDHSWHRVVGLDGDGRRIGVWGIIGGGNPTIVPAPVVEEWVRRANRDGVVVDLAEKLDELRRGYGKGSEVRLLGGAWDGHTGICQWVDDRGVSVRVELLGRNVSVYVPLVGSQTKVVPAAQTSVISSLSRLRRKRRKVLSKLAAM
jgi:transcription antitermination factor NusG